jgi:hypothetical protein
MAIGLCQSTPIHGFPNSSRFFLIVTEGDELALINGEVQTFQEGHNMRLVLRQST